MVKDPACGVEVDEKTTPTSQYMTTKSTISAALRVKQGSTKTLNNTCRKKLMPITQAIMVATVQLQVAIDQLRVLLGTFTLGCCF